MSRHLAAITIAVALLASSCSSDDGGRSWSDAADAEWPLVTEPIEIVATNDYRLLLGTDSADTGEDPTRCIQLVVDAIGLGCIDVNPEPGSTLGFSATVRANDVRVIWRANTAPDSPAAVPDHFVVWSSLSPEGKRLEAINASGTTHLVWVMQPGEEPWGVQTISTSGSLIKTTTLVGLPGQ